MIKKNHGYLFALVMAAGFIFHGQAFASSLPSVPTSVSAAITAPSQISVTWGASTESSGTIVDYYVYRNGARITTTAGTSLTDSGLPPGYYSYAIASVDANGNASNQSTAASVTLVSDTKAPSVPTAVTITGSTSTMSYYTPTTIKISWTPSTDNVGVAGYYVYRNGKQIVTSTVPLAGNSITDTVVPGTYTYAVTAYDAVQNTSNQSASVTVVVGVDGIAPTTPGKISAQQISAGTVNLTWSTSTDPAEGSEPASGVGGYQIFRNGLQVASVTGSPYADSGLSVGVAYTYTIAAYDMAGNVSPQSPSALVVVQKANGPSVPSGLSAALIGTSTVKLSWNVSSDPIPLLGYNLYRNGVALPQVTSTSYLDQGLAPGTYIYYVSASDVADAASATSSFTGIVVPASVFVPLPNQNTAPFVASSNPNPLIPSSTLPIGSSTPASSTVVTTSNPPITQFLYFGLRGAQVGYLQSTLVANGYLASTSATGFFGNLTLHALQKFQCDKGIVCSPGAGWGMVGPKTRSVLNKS